MMKFSRRTVVVLFAIGALSNAFGIVEPFQPALTNFDVRQRQFGLRVPAEKVHAAAKLRERLPEAQIDFDEITSSPKRIATTRGFLTAPNGVGRAVSDRSVGAFRPDDPHRATKSFLKEHQPLFGHGPEALEKAHVKREYVTPHNGLRTVVWEQEVDGVPVFQAVLISHTTRCGELVNI